MKVTVGTDIIEVERIKKAIESNEKFIETVFTEKEIKYCESKKMTKYEHYSARFAAKEAIYKAISPILNNKYEISWKDAEVVNDINGKPYVNFIDIYMNIKDIDISLSHIKDYAIANAVVTIE